MTGRLPYHHPGDPGRDSSGILHLFIIHTILDMKLQCFDGRDVFDRNKPS
jgi:hypothetical protein